MTPDLCNEVFLAEATSLHRKVALKFLPAEMQQEPTARELKEALGQGYAETGYTGSQKRLADAAARRYGKPGGMHAMAIAMVYLCAGDRDRALEWLEKAYEERDSNMPYIGSPVFETLRGDPRFQDLLRRMNLPL